MKKRTKNDRFPMKNPETDPLGSWTGTPADPDEVPVQDADDL